MDGLTSKAGLPTIDDLTPETWAELGRAFVRGQQADDVVSDGGFFDRDLLAPTPWYGQAPSPRTAARVIDDLRLLRDAIGRCSEETLALFEDPADPAAFVAEVKGMDVAAREPQTLLSRLKRAEWLYPSSAAQLPHGDRPLITAVQGRPLKYKYLEPVFVLLGIWKQSRPILISGKRNQSADGASSERYKFSPMIEFMGDALLVIDPSLDTDEEDIPTTEADPSKRRTSVENARLTAWTSASQLRKMIHFENSAGVRKLFEIDG